MSHKTLRKAQCVCSPLSSRGDRHVCHDGMEVSWEGGFQYSAGNLFFKHKGLLYLPKACPQKQILNQNLIVAVNFCAKADSKMLYS